jgi:hypothetical protein
MSSPRAVAMVVSASLALLFLADTSAGANGSKSKRVRYGADVQTGSAASMVCRFSAELEPLLFRLATVADRYGVVRMAIRNAGDRKLPLSLTADRMEVLFASGARPAILDLGAHDPAAWDSLPAEARAAVAYPRSVEAGEEESVFVFVPVADTTMTPQAFRYTIASLPAGPVLIRDVTPVKVR